MDADSRLVAGVDKIVNDLVGVLHVGDIARVHVQSRRLVEFGIAGPATVVLACIADGMQGVPIYAFDNPVSGVIVYAAAAARGPDCGHDIETIIRSAIQAIQAKILMGTGRPSGSRLAVLLGQGARSQKSG